MLIRALLLLPIAALFLVGRAETPATAAHASPTISQSIPLAPGAFGVGVDPVTHRVFAASGAAATVTVIDGVTRSVTGTIAVPGAHDVAVDSVARRLYVTRAAFNQVQVFDISGSAPSLITSIPVGNYPSSIAVNESTNRVFVVNEADYTMSIISGVTNSIVANVFVGGWAKAIAVNPVTNKVYVPSAYGLRVIDGSDLSVQTIPGVGGAVAVNPVTNRIYVASAHVWVVDGDTNTVLATVLSVNAQAIAVNSTTNLAYTTGIVIDGFTDATQPIAGFEPGVDQRMAADEGLDLVYVTSQGGGQSAFLSIIENDSDGDGTGDGVDNCPTEPNGTQIDTDNDGAGDACDTDDDSDGLTDASDNCPLSVNPGQENSVHPGTPSGDACEDADADTIVDATDNCPDDSNSSQADLDGDSQGDACDPDDDGDGISDAVDNCPVLANSGQQNSDIDSWGDACDNCPATENEGQANLDSDALGDACDPDLDGDGFSNEADPDADADGVASDAETPCGADPLDHWTEPEKIGSTDDDGDGLVNEPLPPGADAYDCDGDGYTGAAERSIFEYWLPGFGDTFDQRACGFPGWPSNTNRGTDYRVTVLDITAFLAPYRWLNTDVSPSSGQWLDLIPGKGAFPYEINVTDLTALISGPTGYPPMFGFSRALNGPTCLSAQ